MLWRSRGTDVWSSALAAVVLCAALGEVAHVWQGCRCTFAVPSPVWRGRGLVSDCTTAIPPCWVPQLPGRADWKSHPPTLAESNRCGSTCEDVIVNRHAGEAGASAGEAAMRMCMCLRDLRPQGVGACLQQLLLCRGPCQLADDSPGCDDGWHATAAPVGMCSCRCSAPGPPCRPASGLQVNHWNAGSRTEESKRPLPAGTMMLRRVACKSLPEPL